MRTGTGLASRIPGYLEGRPEPVPIFSQTLSFGVLPHIPANCPAFENSLRRPPLHQLNLDIRRHRLVFGVLGKLDADDRFAGLGVGGDPNWAVIEHASTAIVQPAQELLLFALGVAIDQRRFHSLGIRQ